MNYDPNNILNSEETNFVKLSVYQSLEAENARLKAEVTDLKFTADRFKAEVERLTKAGDAICKSFDEFGQVDAMTLKGWRAAKSPTPLPNDNPTPRPL
jgi:hypothetical protein